MERGSDLKFHFVSIPVLEETGSFSFILVKYTVPVPLPYVDLHLPAAPGLYYRTVHVDYI